PGSTSSMNNGSGTTSLPPLFSNLSDGNRFVVAELEADDKRSQELALRLQQEEEELVERERRAAMRKPSLVLVPGVNGSLRMQSRRTTSFEPHSQEHEENSILKPFNSAANIASGSGARLSPPAGAQVTAIGSNFSVNRAQTNLTDQNPHREGIHATQPVYSNPPSGRAGASLRGGRGGGMTIPALATFTGAISGASRAVESVADAGSDRDGVAVGGGRGRGRGARGGASPSGVVHGGFRGSAARGSAGRGTVRGAGRGGTGRGRGANGGGGGNDGAGGGGGRTMQEMEASDLAYATMLQEQENARAARGMAGQFWRNSVHEGQHR
ncbi:hypothetical protein DL93DRAFT_2081256, partial [Clavulina sp. PMI_390]